MTGHRRSIRLPEFDYASAGAYFVTICTHGRCCLLGDVIDNTVDLNRFGHIVDNEWLRTPIVRRGVELNVYVIMPNHIHGIIVLVGATGSVAPGSDPERATQRVAPTGPARGSIGAIIGQFESVTAKRINLLCHTPGAFVWQRNHYEHVIRNEKELSRAREYVVNNPLRCSLDRDNPKRAHNPVGARRVEDPEQSRGAVPEAPEFPVGARPAVPS